MRCLTLLFFSAVFALAGDQIPARSGEPVIPDELIIKFHAGTDSATLVRSLTPQALITFSAARYNYVVVKVPPQIRDQIAAILAQHPSTIFVEPNRPRKASIQSPNDPLYSAQWALQTVQALSAWKLIPNQYLTASTAGTNRVKVAVLDTGVDCTHPDFMNPGGTSTDSALGGQLLFAGSQAPVPTTIASPTCSWQDDFGHGTHVAGIVAAATQNGTGVASVGYPLQVLVFKVLDSTGSGNDATIANAIMAAADAGAKIISMSLGGPGYSQTLQSAITYAWQHDVMVVAAAGNSSTSALTFPAGGTFAMGVSATDSTNAKASFSNFGNSVGIAAPGVNIRSTLPTYANQMGAVNYGDLSGTSMATPHAAAVSGMIAMTTPNATAAAVSQRLQQSAVSTIINGGWDQNFGYGVINSYNAVSGTLRTATLGSVLGQIVNSSGTPIANALVTIGSQSVQADTYGLFRMPSLSPGKYSVSVTATGQTAQNLTATVAPGADSRLIITMGITYAHVTGRVLDAGVPQAGVPVQALSGGLIVATTASDPSGVYDLWVPAGTYDIRASAISHAAGTITAQSIASGAVKTVDVNFFAFGTISGTVRNGSGQTLTNTEVSITGPSFSTSALTNSNGVYQSIGLPAGSYTITLNGSSPASATVSNDNLTIVNLTVSTSSNSTLAVFGTGVASSGVLAADGAVDAHYQLIASADPNVPGPNAYVIPSNVFPIGPWLADGPNSKWIAPTASQSSGNAGGSYTYRTTFNLSGYNPATAVLSGQMAGDNSVTMKLNGVAVTNNGVGFTSFTPFTISSGFVAGVNTVDFVVTNDGNYISPTGLRVDLSITATPSQGTTIAVSLSPKTITLGQSQQQPFTATVTGTANTNVSWTLTPNVGTMNGNVYTAPATITATQTVTLKATSQADGLTSDTATITLSPPAPAQTLAVFGTGVASSGVLAADGAVDAHYQLIASADPNVPGPNAYVIPSNVFPIGPWLADGPNSKWIAPTASQSSGNAGGSYTYRTTFNLSGYNPATAVLSGQMAGDNSVTMKLNGVAVTNNAVGFTSFTPFTISSGFVAGVNTVDFVVTNDGNYISPTGLRVDLSITATPSQGTTIAVSLSPKTITLGQSQQQPFTATVTGTANTNVSWTLTPNVGTMNGNVYTAPATITATQTVTLKATSQADGLTSDTATITLSPPAPAQTLAVFGTGVASSGVLAADGAVDAHYQLIASADPNVPGPNAYVIPSNVFPIGPWLANGPNSKWIAPTASQSSGNAGGSYTYRTTFNLTGYNPATAVLSGQMAGDNSVTMKLNGVAVTNNAVGFTSFTPFTISSGFVAGVNTVDFVVTNDGNYTSPTGLRVDLSITAK